jgi:bifunctional DNase/RNase
MEKVQLDIVGLSYSQTQSGAYALVLSELEGNRRLPVIIGGFEAQAIAIELEGMTPSRPLTHDLFKSFSEEFNFDVKEVIIYNLIEGIFFSKLICTNSDGKKVEIDTRTSDAIAIAVRFNCPIFAYEFILSSAGILLEEEEEIDDDNFDAGDGMVIQLESSKKDETSIEDLEKSLQSAIKNEDYEKASKIRDEITKRQSKQGDN